MNNRPLLHQRIVANAGSGKTYRLTSRFIELLAREVPPERIIALTFTRKAAGEFLDAIFARLLSASRGELQARQLAADIGFPHLGCDVFRGYLSLLVEKLPQLALGTLDGFFGRIVRAFPFECGLTGDISILDPHLQDITRRAVLAGVFRAHSASERSFRELLELLRRQSRNRQARSVTAVLDAEIRLLHEKFLLTPSRVMWGDPRTIWEEAPSSDDDALLPRLVDNFSQALFSLHEDMLEKHRLGWEARITALRRLRPGNDVPKDSLSFALKALSPVSSKKPGHFELKIGNKGFSFPETLRSLIVDMGRAILAIDMQTRLDRSRALYELVAKFERAYRQNVREAGRLTFLDITGLLASSHGSLWAGSSLQSYVRQSIDYRLDATYDHWLLDEFQDTSRLQWQAIHGLVDEIIQSDSGRRSFFYVGDTKQAIYSWRGGDPRLFDEIAAYYNSSGETHIDTSESLAVSYRSLPEILDGINTLFDPDHLARLSTDMEFPPDVIERWRSAWRTHEPSRPERGSGFFQWETFSIDDGPASVFLDQQAARLLMEVDPVARGWSCAVLVQTNKRIASIVNTLRAAGLSAAAEGRLFPCSDNGLASAFLDLLRVIAHPLDSLALAHIRMTPLHALLAGGLEEFRLTALRDVRLLGIAGALRRWADFLALDLNDFQRARMETLIDAASEFDAAGRNSPLDEFVEFAGNFSTTENASGAAIRVMTMHAAKGLDFDMVVLPEMEGVALPSRRDESSIHLHRDASGTVQWGMELPPKAVCEADPMLSTAYEQDVAEDCYEKLALYYVALTRARRGLYVLTSQQKEDSKSHDFNRLLHLTFDEGSRSIGDPRWYHAQPLPGQQEELPCASLSFPPPSRPQGVFLRPVQPSDRLSASLPAETFFSRNDAAAFGVAVHSAFSRIQWLEDSEPDFGDQEPSIARLLRDFFRSPAAICFRRIKGNIRLWVEKPFDLVLNGQRISGIFDRVILKPDGADLYDFKTEDSEPSRILASHREQMMLYRDCLAMLTGLPRPAIAASIVCVRAGVLLSVE